MNNWTDDDNDKENEDSAPKEEMRKDLCRKVTAKDRFAESTSKLWNYTVHTQQFWKGQHAMWRLAS